MKNIILIIAALLINSGVFAQATPTETKTQKVVRGAIVEREEVGPVETKVVKSETKYFCPKCDNSSSSAGKCSHDQIDLVQEGKYYCPMHREVTSDKPGKCPKCEMALVKMEAETVGKYACPKCDWTIPPVKGQCPHSTQAIMKEGELKCVYCHDSAGKCTKCGAEMEKIKIRKKKESKKG